MILNLILPDRKDQAHQRAGHRGAQRAVRDKANDLFSVDEHLNHPGDECANQKVRQCLDENPQKHGGKEV